MPDDTSHPDPRIGAHSLQNLALARGHGRGKVARALADAGVGAGDLVEILGAGSDASPDWRAEAILAAWSLGAGVCPLPSGRPEGLAGLAATFRLGPQDQVLALEGAWCSPLPRRVATGVDVALCEPAASGKGGRIFTHANLIAAARGLSATLGVTAEDRVAHVTWGQGAELAHLLAFALFSGHELRLVPPEQAGNPAAFCGATVLGVAPGCAGRLATLADALDASPEGATPSRSPVPRRIVLFRPDPETLQNPALRRLLSRSEAIVIDGAGHCPTATWRAPGDAWPGRPMPGLDLRRLACAPNAGPDSGLIEVGRGGALYLRGDAVSAGWLGADPADPCPVASVQAWRDDIWVELPQPAAAAMSADKEGQA